MNTKKDEYYNAIRNRDSRYDGRFVTCVLTTGIYCRAICPARTPKFHNVKFLPCAAAAEEAGFRPCRRCCPESSPGLPAWMGTSAVVRRGLRMINNGDLDHQSIQQFASRLGVSDRHLRRLFEKHLGCAPTQIAQTRRLHFARKLLVETNLPMTKVAASSGFSSVRRFNSAFSSTFDCPPADFRGKNSRQFQSNPNAKFQLSVPFRRPFHWKGLFDYLSARTIPGVEQTSEKIYRRTFTAGMDSGDSKPGVIQIRFDSLDNDPEASEIPIEVFHEDSDILLKIISRSKRILDTDCCPDDVGRTLSECEKLRPMVESLPGLRVPGCWDGFELAVRAILGQQVSVKSAKAIAGRVAAAFGQKFSNERFGDLEYVFPGPEDLREARLEEHGVIRRRAEAIRELSNQVIHKKIVLDETANPEEVFERLCQIPCIGPWTASYICLRAIGDPNAFPSSDLVLKQQLSSLFQKQLNAKELEKISSRWNPFRSYAAVYLWNGAANE